LLLLGLAGRAALLRLGCVFGHGAAPYRWLLFFCLDGILRAGDVASSPPKRDFRRYGVIVRHLQQSMRPKLEFLTLKVASACSAGRIARRIQRRQQGWNRCGPVNFDRAAGKVDADGPGAWDAGKGSLYAGLAMAAAHVGNRKSCHGILFPPLRAE
jgi:hypothetical protein